MADAIAAKGMFYINASVTNTHNEDRLAEIIIQSNSDMLHRDQGWMVHITRFALSTQQSLHFMDKDEDMYITFRYENTNVGNAIRQNTWRATEDINTLATFLAKINDAIPVMDHPQGAVPVGKFTVTQDGRFRLESHNSFDLGPEQFLGIKPSPKLAAVLGWDTAELNISFQASEDLKTRQYIRWYESIFGEYFREKYLYDNHPDQWFDTHEALVQYFMWHFANGLGANIGNQMANAAPGVMGNGPDGILYNGPAGGPYLDDWQHPRTRPMDITVFYRIDPALVTNHGHGRMVGIYYRHALAANGHYTLRDSTTHVVPTVPVAGPPNLGKLIFNSDIVMGEINEMRLVSIDASRRVMRVGRAPDQTQANGFNTAYGRFARIGDSLYLSYVRPGQPNGYDESHMFEFKIIRIVEVVPANEYEWGPAANVDNHFGFNGRQQDLYLDCPVPLENHTRLAGHLGQVNAGNVGANSLLW